MTINNNGKHDLEIATIVLVAIVTIVATLVAILAPTTTETPTVKMGVEINDNDWRIAPSANGQVYALEMFVPARANQEIVVEYDNNQITRRVGEYGIVIFAIPLDVREVTVT